MTRSLTLVALLACVAAGLAATQQPPATRQGPAGQEQSPGYWCPMHPDVRGGAGEKCSQCGMALVRIAATDYRPYLLDFAITPRALRPGQQGRARFFVRDPRTGATVRRLALMHERVFHLFIISHDLAHFAHVHPRMHGNGSLDVDFTVPRAGAYQLIADFLPEGGAPQLVQRSFVTAGYTEALATPPVLAPDAADKVIDGTRVKLTMPEPFAGREQLITFDLLDETTGAPATDLEPYLGATGHLLLASADLAIAFHAHPVAEISARAGPTVVFQVLFPRPGDYRLWAQFQRRGGVLTSSFTVPVKSQD
jgi:hypothetical protein